MIQIDQSQVYQMVVGRLKQGLDADAGTQLVTLLVKGDPDPEVVEGTTAPWVRVQKIDTQQLPRHRSDNEPDHADVSVSLTVVVPAWVSEQAAAKASGIAAAVSRTLADETITDPTSGHYVDLRESKVEELPDLFDERGLAVVTITIVGTICRTTGNSILAPSLPYAASPSAS